MRRKVARALRKWADLVDPRTEPSNVARIRVDVDSAEAEDAIRRLAERAEQLRRTVQAALWVD